MILQTHYIAQPLPCADENSCSYSLTLATRLGRMLIEIESLYGQRDKEYTFIGVEFSSNGPQNWFPRNCKNVIIQLNLNALNDDTIACYQLAHEAIHLLAPDGQNGAPVIEEGLATVYSEDFVQREFNTTNLTGRLSYIDAAQKVRELISIDTDAIKKLRNIEPSFKEMTAATFNLAGLNLPQDTIDCLLTRFVR